MNQLDLFPTSETRCRTWQEVDRTRGLSKEAKAWLGHRYTEHRLQEDAANMDEDLILPGPCVSPNELKRQQQRVADYLGREPTPWHTIIGGDPEHYSNGPVDRSKIHPWDVTECDPQHDPHFRRKIW